MGPGTRAGIDGTIGPSGGSAIMLDVDHRTRQALDGAHYFCYIGGVKPDCRLIQNVQYLLEPTGE